MRTFRYIILISSLALSVSKLQAQDIHTHQQWGALLSAYVDQQGHVDYKSIKKNQKDLDAYLSLLNANAPKDSWTENQKKAYLINAYNAFTVKLIIDNYPLESIRDIGGFFNNPFTTKFAKIGNKEYSLDDIEKGMLLKMGDARVHFAVNCASESCPKLVNEAFVASKLNQQLDAAAKDFIHSKNNKLSSNKLELSKIFKWYSSDFEKDGNSVITFINSYTDQKISKNASISYLSYSWKLNEK